MADKKKAVKAGRSGKKPKVAKYKLNHVREKNKVVKIAKSNGYKHALAYAATKMITSWAKTRLAGFDFGREAA